MTMTKKDLLSLLAEVDDEAVVLVHDGTTDGLMDWTTAKTVDEVHAFVDNDTVWFSKGANEGSVPAMIIS